MTIRIVGEEDTSEGRAANDLADLMRADLSSRSKSDNSNLKVAIVPNVQAYGEKRPDLDIVLLLKDSNKRPSFETVKGESNDLIRVVSLCVVIEVKDHMPQDVKFEGTKAFVRYNGKWSSASEQSHDQIYSLSNFAKKSLGPEFRSWVNNVIWLRNVPNEALPSGTHNILGSNSDWARFLQCIALIDSRTTSDNSFRAFFTEQSFSSLHQLLTKKIMPTSMDRRKMEAVTRRLFKEEGSRWQERLGAQLLIFRGRGGTGKTVRLLNLAHELYETEGSRVLILTYNNALVSDLRRLISLLAIKSGSDEAGISVKTIHSFIWTWLSTLGIKPKNDFLTEYLGLISEATSLIAGGALDQSDIQNAIREHNVDLAWDFIMIDEAQDWPESERNLLYALYDFRKFVVADGIDQMTRGQEIANWRTNLDTRETQIIPLRKSLRLKQNICQFVIDLSEKLDFRWDVEPEMESYGGNIIVVVGKENLTQEFHEKLFGQVRGDGNELVDMLFCVPPEWVKTTDGQRHAWPATKFQEWGYRVWDATNEQDRRAFPTQESQLRVIQYASCRGLEGWTVLNYALDRFYDQQVESADVTNFQDELFHTEEDQRKVIANQWLMIPLSRAIDTLVIHLERKDSYLGSILEEMKGRENLSWIE
ncbi:hypothetical protein ACMAY5_00665 [Arenicellales bacterium nBUS_48]